jgi:hypothetical protein
MLPKNQIFVFDHMVSDEMCDKVISLFQEVPLREEKYGKNCNVECKIFKVNDIIDNFKRTFFDKSIFEIVGNIVKELRSYNIDIFGDSGYQIRKIHGPTRIHTDGVLTGENVNPMEIRNMSIIMALNEDYDGGELCFPEQDFTIKLKKGQAVAFPPYWTHPHYTNELKNNTFRYTINTWLYGR